VGSVSSSESSIGAAADDNKEDDDDSFTPALLRCLLIALCTGDIRQGLLGKSIPLVVIARGENGVWSGWVRIMSESFKARNAS